MAGLGHTTNAQEQKKNEAHSGQACGSQSSVLSLAHPSYVVLVLCLEVPSSNSSETEARPRWPRPKSQEAYTST